MKEYKKCGEVKYFPIRKKDFADLTELILENSTPNYASYISTESDTLKIEENSIEAFLAHKEVPDPLSRYAIQHIGYDSNHGKEKDIYLQMRSKNSTFLSVSGMNQAWVLGKFQQINDFIDGKLKQYEDEKKSSAVEYKDKEIVIPETLLQKLERRSLLDRVVALAVIAGAIIAALQLRLMWLQR